MEKDADEQSDGLTEAELYAPDLDEGELDVETYEVPDSSGIDDPYLASVWDAAKKLIDSGSVIPPTA